MLPISDCDIQNIFAPLSQARGLVLAVSGGPDSLALMLLAARWRELAQAASSSAIPRISVATVDHGLRPEAIAEAETVAMLARQAGFAVQVLRWEGAKPARGIQEAARAARYALLVEAARREGASHIVSAHHRDDQGETVLMRLAAGSGITGLGAMRVETRLTPAGEEPAVFLARPLLGLSKAQLVETVRAVAIRAAEWQAVDDPSNADPRYARGRLRGHMGQREALGLTDERLVVLSQRCARADAALEHFAALRFQTLAQTADGRVRLDAAIWEETEEIALRCLGKAVGHLTGATIRLLRLEGLLADLQQAQAGGKCLKRTLGGALIKMDARGALELTPEAPRRRGRAMADGL